MFTCQYLAMDRDKQSQSWRQHEKQRFIKKYGISYLFNDVRRICLGKSIKLVLVWKVMFSI